MAEALFEKDSDKLSPLNASPILGARSRSHSATGVPSRRRVSRAFEVRPSIKSNKPLMVWLQEHLSKQTIGLILNFLVLLTLLAMLITIVSHFKYWG